jgi:hypothetical protein
MDSFADQEDEMRKFVTALTVMAGLTVMAAPALAQAGQERERPDFERRGMRGGGPAAQMRAPGAMLLEHRAELGLTAEQIRQIEAIQERVKAANAPRLEQLQAGLGERGPVRDRTRRDMTAEERQAFRDRMRAGAEQMRSVMQEVRETNRGAGDQIHALLTTEQKAAVLDLRREARGEWQNRRGERRDGFRGDRRPMRGQRGPGR